MLRHSAIYSNVRSLNLLLIHQTLIAHLRKAEVFARNYFAVGDGIAVVDVIAHDGAIFKHRWHHHFATIGNRLQHSIFESSSSSSNHNCSSSESRGHCKKFFAVGGVVAVVGAVVADDAATGGGGKGGCRSRVRR